MNNINTIRHELSTIILSINKSNNFYNMNDNDNNEQNITKYNKIYINKFKLGYHYETIQIIQIV